MAGCLRIATFNVENLDDRDGLEPSLAERIPVLRPQLERLAADVLCLQEVHGQPHEKHAERGLEALDRLIEDTGYAGFERAMTTSPSGGAMDVHNLVILSRFPIVEHRQVRHEVVPAPSYRMVTAEPPAEDAAPVEWDRPALHARIDVDGEALHIVNLHLRAPRASFVPGQKKDARRWRTMRGWAEGFFIASMKRTGQACEVRMLVEELFERDETVRVAVCGDMNAETFEMPVRLIRGDMSDTQAPDLARRVLVPAEDLVPEARRYSIAHAGRRAMYDHILVSATLSDRLRRAEVDNEELLDEVDDVGDEPVPQSLHAPLVAEFTWP